ncbi:MAG: UbiX family flavin prenyltransferase [Gaiellales bacterium]
MHVFLGITGASGAPYAARLLQGFASAGVQVGVAASASAGEVIAWEVYRDRTIPAETAVERFVAEFGGDGATLYGERDWFAPYASGSAKVDAYVICPCSMATCGTIASSSQANLIHRAASVALKERRTLILVPRETPLSLLHLRALTALTEAGAIVAPASPGFYGHPDSVDDMVDFVAGRVFDLCGIDNALLQRWGTDA